MRTMYVYLYSPCVLACAGGTGGDAGQKSIIARQAAKRRQSALGASAKGAADAAAAGGARRSGEGGGADGARPFEPRMTLRKHWKDEPVEVFVPGRQGVGRGRRRRVIRHAGRRMHYAIFGGNSSDSDSGGGGLLVVDPRMRALRGASTGAATGGNDSGSEASDAEGGDAGGGAATGLTLSEGLEAIRCPSWWLTGGLVRLSLRSLFHHPGPFILLCPAHRPLAAARTQQQNHLFHPRRLRSWPRLAATSASGWASTRRWWSCP